MNKEQQGLLDEVYKNYWGKVSVNNEEDCLVKQEEGSLLKEVRVLYQQEFINKCKTDIEFSEKWGLTIEERELNTDERNKWFQINLNGNNPLMKSDWKDYELDQQNIPTKQITLEYNNEKTYYYE
jgi:hypothetical protein